MPERQPVQVYMEQYKNGTLAYKDNLNFAWAIYYALKDTNNAFLTNVNEISTKNVKILLNTFLHLNIPKPSLVNSLILRFAIKYSKVCSNFNLMAFYKYWGNAFSEKDFQDSVTDSGAKVPALIKSFAQAIIDKTLPVAYEDIQTVRNMFELCLEKLFWNIFNAEKEGNYKKLWDLFDYYLAYFAKKESSHYNSEILNLALRFMSEQQSYRFPNFFYAWGETFKEEDWEVKTIIIKNELKEIPSLISRTLKHCLASIQMSEERDPKILNYLEKLYKELIFDRHDESQWLLRDLAIVYELKNEQQQAYDLYKKLIPRLKTQSYFWKEFSLLEQDAERRLAMLCHAIKICRNEDLLGNTRLLLADELIKRNLDSEAFYELQKYKEFREKKNWQISKDFDVRMDKLVNTTKILENNDELYNKYDGVVDDFIYQDIPSRLYFLTEFYKKDKDTFAVLCDNSKELVRLRTSKFDILQNVKIGTSFEVKLETEKRPDGFVKFHIISIKEQVDTPLWNGIQERVGIINFINKEKSLLYLYEKNGSCFVARVSDVNSFKLHSFCRFRALFFREKDNQIKSKVVNLSQCSDMSFLQEYSYKYCFVGVIDESRNRVKLFSITQDFLDMGGVDYYKDLEDDGFYDVDFGIFLDDPNKKIDNLNTFFSYYWDDFFTFVELNKFSNINFEVCSTNCFLKVYYVNDYDKNGKQIKRAIYLEQVDEANIEI